MSELWKNLEHRVVESWQLVLITAGALAYAVVCIVQEIHLELAGALSVLALGIIMGIRSFDTVSRRNFPLTIYGKVAAWLLLAVGIGLLLAPGIMQKPTGVNLVLLLFFLAAICWFCGWQTMMWMFIPIFIFVLVVPLREQLLLFFSYPLRLSSTTISVWLLQLFGMDISSHLTTIQVGRQDIAITDACSGIQQLEAMLLVAYLLVQPGHRIFIWKMVHYLFLLPAIIFSNAVRIILIVLLYNGVGESVLVGAWHIGLGYFQLVLALALIYGAGFFLPDPGQKHGNNGKSS